ncbi:MAG TPA: hypothetical protein VIM15_03145 [Gemmatimonadaceae bacterium]
MSARLRSAWLVVVLACPALRAQAAPTLLQRLPMLDAKKVASVDRGEAVAISLETPEKTEIAILGVVRIEVPRAFYVDRARNLIGFLATGTRSFSGSFGEPARLDDVATLALDPADSKALAKCHPLECDVKLPAAEMEKLRAELAGSHSPAARADSLMREWLVAYVNAYRSDSMEETVVYDDTKHPVRSSDAFRALLAEPMLAGLDAEPFAAMLATPRSARPAAVASRISWELDHVSGLKPLLEVLERSMYSSPARPDVNWMSSKLLYASHYFESQLDFITVADAPSSPGSSAMYLVILRRSKFDDLPSGGLFNIRGRAVKKLRDALRTTLSNTRDELGKAYADSAAPAPRAP